MRDNSAYCMADRAYKLRASIYVALCLNQRRLWLQGIWAII